AKALTVSAIRFGSRAQVDRVKKVSAWPALQSSLARKYISEGLTTFACMTPLTLQGVHHHTYGQKNDGVLQNEYTSSLFHLVSRGFAHACTTNRVQSRCPTNRVQRCTPFVVQRCPTNRVQRKKILKKIYKDICRV